MSLSVERDNEVAVRLYERAGFEAVSGDERAWTMQCLIASTP